MKKLLGFIHHLFIPHENNNFRAKSLHPDFLMMYLVFALVLTVFSKTSGVDILGFATDVTAEKLYQLTNQEKENIINKNYTQVGYAIVNGVLNGEETTLVVQMFNKPINPTVADVRSLIK